MKSLVVYDSQFGNTRKIAEAIGKALEESGKGMVRHVSDVQAGDLMGLNILVVGTPTQRFAATPAVKNWLNQLPTEALEGVRGAAFDTRFTQEKIDEIPVLAFFVRLFGYGAEPIARKLSDKGVRVEIEPEGFYVGDTEGPLLENELQRAREWAQKIFRSG